MTDTINVTGTYVVGAGKTLDFVNQDAFHLLDGETPPRLVIAGSVSVTNADHTGETFGAVAVSTPGGQGVTVVIREGGVLSLDTQNQGVGVALDTLDSRFVNQGDLRVSSSAIFAVGVRGTGDVKNSGEIAVQSASEARGLDLSAPATVANSGVIRATGGDQAEGLNLFFATEIDNHGKIIAEAPGDFSSYGIRVGAGSESSGLIHVVNSGLIRGDYAIQVFSGDATIDLENSGVIQGQMLLSDGADHVVNTGHIAGATDLGGGDDSFDGSAGVIDGVLRGGGGDDLLISGRGQDILIGDLGADTLTGGGGPDYFVFETVEDSHGAAVDLITDLKNKDIIDVSSIDADSTQAGFQVFHLVAALGGHAGELALSYDAETGLTTLAGDVDGDGHADLKVQIAGDHANFTHFVL